MEEAVLKAWVTEGGTVFVCMDWRHVGEMSEALDALGVDLLNICVWVKANPGMGVAGRVRRNPVEAGRAAS